MGFKIQYSFIVYILQALSNWVPADIISALGADTDEYRILLRGKPVAKYQYLDSIEGALGGTFDMVCLIQTYNMCITSISVFSFIVSFGQNPGVRGSVNKRAKPSEDIQFNKS